MFILSGCSSAGEKVDNEYKKTVDNETIMKEERQKSIDACIERGGVPVISSWTGLLKRCDFPK